MKLNRHTQCHVRSVPIEFHLLSLPRSRDHRDTKIRFSTFMTQPLMQRACNSFFSSGPVTVPMAMAGSIGFEVVNACMDDSMIGSELEVYLHRSCNVAGCQLTSSSLRAGRASRRPRLTSRRLPSAACVVMSCRKVLNSDLLVS